MPRNDARSVLKDRKLVTNWTGRVTSENKKPSLEVTDKRMTASHATVSTGLERVDPRRFKLRRCVGTDAISSALRRVGTMNGYAG